MTFFLIFATTLLVQSLGAIYQSYNIASGLYPIIAFSAGEAHITIAYGNRSASTMTTVQKYDAPTNTTTTLATNLSIKITNITKFSQLFINTTIPTTRYLMEQPGSLSCVRSNFTFVKKLLQDPSSESSHSCFGPTPSVVYYCFNSVSTMSII